MNTHKLAGLAVFLSFGSSAFAQSASDIFDEYTGLYSDTWRVETMTDLTSDSIPDVVGWWWSGDDEIFVRWGKYIGVAGQQGSSSGRTLGGASRPFNQGDDNATVAGDLNGDGKSDVVITIGRFIEVLVAEHPFGGLQIPYLDHVQSLDLPLDVQKRAAVAHDFDGDGRDEIVLVFPHEVRLYSPDQNGLLHLLDSQVIFAGQAWQRQPTAEVTDFDGDGQADLAVFSPSLFRVSVFPISGLQIGSPEILRTDLGGAAVQLAAGDVDGDGDVDLAVFQEEIGAGPPLYQIVRRNAVGELASGDVRVGGPAASLVDVDGDGDLDGVCCGGGGGGGYSGPRNEAPSVFRVCLNDGSGVFEVSAAFPSVGAHHLAAAYDHDGDGDIDLVAGRGVLLNNQRAGMTYCAQGANSTGDSGSLAVSGSARIDAGDFTVSLSDLPSNALYVLVSGLPVPDPVVTVGAGTLCMSSHTVRRSILGASDASGTALIDIGATIGLGGLPPHYSSQVSLEPGTSVGLQVWHRDLPTHGSSNVTNGVAVLIAN